MFIVINPQNVWCIFKNFSVSGVSLMKHCGVQIPKLKSRVTKVAGPEQNQSKSEATGSKKKKGRK